MSQTSAAQKLACVYGGITQYSLLSIRSSMKHHSKKHRKKRSGCWFVGCSAVVAIFSVILTFVGLFLYLLLSRQAVALPELEGTEAQYLSVKERVDSFTEAMDAGQGARIALTAADLNVLLKFDPRLQPYRRQIRTEIADGKFVGYVSFPVDMFESLQRWMPFAMFLNGRAIFEWKMNQGLPAAYLVDLQIKGRPFPEVFVKQIRRENMLDPLLGNPSNRQRAAKLKSIGVSDNALVLESRGAAAPAEK